MKRSNNGNSSWRKFKRTKNGKPRRKNANRNAEENRHPNNENNANKRNHQKKKKGLIQTGNFGSFLEDQEWSDEMLLGQMPSRTARTTNDDAPRLTDLECIAQFLADYRAMSTLHVHARQSNNNSPTNGSNTNTNTNTNTNNNNNNNNNNSTCCHAHAHAASSTAYYIPVIQDFALTQKDRQSAGLRTNTSRATSEGMTHVVESHTSALEAAMEHVDPFQSTVFEHHSTDEDSSQDDQLVPTEQTLCRWHSVLVANTITSASTNNNNNNNNNAKSRTKAVPNSTEGGVAAAAAAAARNINITTTAAIPTAPSFFRKSRAKAGKTIFCPPEDIPKEFRQFRSAMIRYCHQWESKILHLPELRKRSESITSMAVDSAAATQLANQMTQQKHSSVYHALGVAAMYLFGIVDIHMYSDGNGRMSRIGANWMLKRMLGWPFTITLVANPQQRREYISALQHAVNCIQVIRKQQQQKKSPIRLNGSVFRPLILLLLDRMANAVRECQRKLTEKSQLTRAAEEARIARKVREETASGRCVICLDDNPNIATLCCGQGVHLNCVADWLSNNSNCVYCRGPLPQLKLQRPAPPPEEEPENARGAIVSELQNVLAMPDDNFTAATAAAVSRLTSNSVFLNMIRRSLQDQAIENAEDTTTTFFSSDDDEEDDDVEDAENEDDDQSNGTSMLCVNGICMASTQTCCPNGMCSRCCASSGVHCWYHNGRVDTTPADEETVLSDSEDDEEDTTTYYDAEVADNQPPSIRNVGNAAGDNEDTTTFLGSGADESEQDTTTYFGDDAAADDEDLTPWYPGRQQSQRVMSCTTGDCNNRPAADCQNHMCGRCCVLFGQYSCLRHNTGTYAN
ncbi:MAG: hypothetical protein SGBAC_001786 [Bacillariaceae sp.]